MHYDECKKIIIIIFIQLKYLTCMISRIGYDLDRLAAACLVEPG